MFPIQKKSFFYVSNLICFQSMFPIYILPGSMRSLLSNLKIWTDSAVCRFLFLNLKYGQTWRSMDTYFKIRTNLVVHGSLHPYSKIRTKLAVHGSRHSFLKIRTNLVFHWSLYFNSKIRTYLAVHGSLGDYILFICFLFSWWPLWI